MQLICSIQYRVVKAHADDAFYELQNPDEQIRAYVFDGTFLCSSFLVSAYNYIMLFIYNLSFPVLSLLFIFVTKNVSFLGVVVRALVPRMNLDDLFEQKGEVAKAVLEELGKVIWCILFLKFALI